MSNNAKDAKPEIACNENGPYIVNNVGCMTILRLRSQIIWV